MNKIFCVEDDSNIRELISYTLSSVGFEVESFESAGRFFSRIEEEIPKRKKSIIIRIIVMIAFLFLTLITQLIISLAEGVSILDVS